MAFLKEYLADNLPLFSICVVMLFIALRNIKLRKKESLYFIAFAAILLMLSIVVAVERYSQAPGGMGNVVVSTIFTSLGYILRPSLLYIFILLANMEYKRSKAFYITCLLPLGIALFVYLIPLFINVTPLREVVFYYTDNGDGTVKFHRGGFLNFTSHAMSLIYLGILVYVSTMRFHGKHRRDGLVLIICVAIILATVITEMLYPRNDLLNIVCGICMMINYIFILSVNSSRDPLTNLYDRRTYYEDVSRYKGLINGIIQIDMNGLKYVNDNYGHNSGDHALMIISNILENNVIKGEMCAYRLSGDEFLILMFQGKKEDLQKAVQMIKDSMSNTDYTIAMGYYFIEKKEKVSFEEAMKKAEELMYHDKADYYLSSGRDRRKQ